MIHGSGNPGPSRRSHEDSLAASNLDANGLFRLSFLRNPEMPNVCYSNSAMCLIFNIGPFQRFLKMCENTNSPLLQELIRISKVQPGLFATAQTTFIRNLMYEFEKRLPREERSGENWSDPDCQRDVAHFIEFFFKCLQHEVRSDSVATAELKKMFTDHYEIFYNCKKSNNTNQSCRTFQMPSEVNFPFVSLGVEGFTNLHDCFERRDSELDRKCDDCGYHTFEKEFTVSSQNPDVLLLKLKIYKRNGKAKVGHKMHIPFHLKCKNYDPYVLVGASLHRGSELNSGHYDCLIINPNTRKAVLMDDNGQKREINSEEEIQSLLRDGYMLAYEKEEVFKQRSQGQSPVKKRPKSMEVSVCNQGDLGTPAPAPTDDIQSRILTSQIFIDLKNCRKETAVEFCQALGLDSSGKLAELRQCLDKVISDIIQKSDLSLEQKMDLCKRYKVSKAKTMTTEEGGVGEGSKKGSGHKTGGIFQKAANSVRNLFNRGDNTTSQEFEPKEVINILDKLGNMDRKEVLQILEALGTSKDVVNQPMKQLKQCLRGKLVSQLIDQLTIDKRRELLKVIGIIPYKHNVHNDRLAGQIKSKALEDANTLKTVMAFVLSLDNEQQPLDLDTTASLLDQLSKKWTTADMKALYQKLYADVPADFVKNHSQYDTKLKKEIIDRIVDNLIKDNTFEGVYKEMNIPEVKKSRKKSTFIKFVSSKNFEKLPVFVEQLKKQPIQSSTPEESMPSQEHMDTVASAMEVDESVVEAANMDVDEESNNMEDERSAAADVVDPPASITLTEARQLVHGGHSVERCSKEELVNLYKQLGGSAKTIRSDAYLIKYIKPKALSMVMDKLPSYIWRKVLKDFHLFNGSKGMKTLLHKSAMENAQIMDALTSEFDAIHEHNCCLDDFYPSNWLQIQENVLEMARERQNKLDILNQQSRCVLSADNPMLQAARHMEMEMGELKREYCWRCEEARFESNIDPKTGLCEKCTRTKPKDPDGVWKFSRENHMHPGIVPEQLKNLTTIEQAAIGRLHPQMSIIKYRGGGDEMRGHAVLLQQDVGEFYTRLPLRPQDMPMVALIPNYPTRVPLYANQWKIKYALEWLKLHHPKYIGIVEIDEENLAMYPPDSNTPVVGLPTYEVQGENGDQVQAEGDGEEHHGAERTGEMVETAVFQEVPTELSHQRIRNALNVGGDQGRAEDNQTGGNRPIAMPNRLPGLVSEFTTELLHSMAFPHLFPYGEGDFFQSRDVDVTMLDWIQHLLWLVIPGENGEGGNRFARDRRFIFYVVNLFQRHLAIMLGSVFANNIVGDLTFEQVREALQDPNSNLVKCMRHMSAQIPGTNAVLSHDRKLTKAIEEWVRIHSANQERFTMFLTFSMADNHMHYLHKLLPNHEQYLGKIPVDDTTGLDLDKYIDKKLDWKLRQDNINNNQHIVDYFVHKKMDMLRKLILTPHLGVIDYVIRTEFQSRTAVHFHMIARCVTAPRVEDMETAFRDYFFIEDFQVESARDGIDMTEKEIEDVIEEHKKAGCVIVPVDETEAVREEVDRVRKLTIAFSKLHMGNSALHPELDSGNWPPPFGTNLDPPSTNSLRSTLESVLVDDQTVSAHSASLVSRVQLHNCVRGYCRKKETNPDAPEVCCRFGYPLGLCGFEIRPKKDKDGNVIEGKFDYIRKKPVTNQVRSTLPIYDDVPDGAVFLNKKLYLIRNHPNLVAHIEELMIANGGNMNSETIKNCYTLLEYICKYLTKPETSSMQYNSIMADIAKLAENDYREDAVRKMCSRILMTFIKEHDLGRSEAFHIVSQRPYVEFSREHVYVNLTDKRRLNVEQYLAGNPDAPTLAKNHADKYQNRENEEDYQRALEKYSEDPKSLPGDPREINLYKFAELFEKNWHYTGVCRVPVPSPLYSHCPNKVKLPEAFENYCSTMLFLHKPGTNPINVLWKNVNQEDDGQFESLEAAMQEFVENDRSQCPNHVRQAFLKALQNVEDSTHYSNIDDVDELIQSQGDPEVVGELLPGFAPPNVDLMEDQMDEAYMEMVLAHELNVSETVLLEHDQAHNWQEDRLELGLSDMDIDQLRLNWLTEAKEKFEEHAGVQGQYDPDNLNTVQRKVYDRAMEAVENPDKQYLIDCCGSAGTGKSYTINTILQHAERGSVKIVAPTGAAASQFHGGQTVHALFKINVSRKRSQKGQEQCFKPLTDAQMQDLEEDLEHVKLIIIDEKGMIGLARFHQIHRRLQEGRPHRKNEPFGGMSIMTCGDLKQLPPVFDMPLYGELTDSKKTEATSSGKQLYRLFDQHTYILKQQMRQQGDSNAQFRDDLNRLAGCGQYDQEQYTRWKASMDYNNFSSEQKEDFDNNATVLAAVKADLKTFNANGIKKLGQPVCRAKAKNNPKQAESFKDDQADGLLNEQFFAHGSRVVLTRNMMAKAGLVNGSQGQIKYIVFKEKADTSGEGLPDMLLVKFDNYTGPSYRPDLEDHLVPIFPTLAVWYSRERCYMSRFQYPLLPGYAITIHKSQGKCWYL